jgi:hypothetical protein
VKSTTRNEDVGDKKGRYNFGVEFCPKILIRRPRTKHDSINMHLRQGERTGVDGTGSGCYPMMGFGISCV